MVLYYLTLGTRQSSRTLFPLFAAKTSCRIFDGFCKFSNKVAIPESKCLFGNRDGRLTRVAEQQLLLLRVWHFVVSLISQDENNSFWEQTVSIWTQIFVQTWAKILRRWAQDICKDKASNLGPAAGY